MQKLIGHIFIFSDLEELFWITNQNPDYMTVILGFRSMYLRNRMPETVVKISIYELFSILTKRVARSKEQE